MIYDIESLDCKFVETYFIAFPLTYKIWKMRVKNDYPFELWHEKESLIMYNTIIKHWGLPENCFWRKDWTYIS
jgi:hypothetical protein